MSEREQAIQLLSSVPDYKLGYVIAYLQGVSVGEDIPNAETRAAIDDVNQGKNLSKTFHSVSELMEDLNMSYYTRLAAHI